MGQPRQTTETLHLLHMQYMQTAGEVSFSKLLIAFSAEENTFLPLNSRGINILWLNLADFR